MSSRPRTSTTSVAFWLLGLLNNFSYVVMLSAAEDIISGASGAVLLADILPTLAVKTTAPFWTHHFPYFTRIIVCGVFGVLSFYTTAAATQLWLRLCGIGFASVSSGWGEVTMLSLTSYYDISTINSWSSGTGFAGIAGAGWYLMLHSLLRVSPRLTLLLGGIFPIAFVLVYRYALKQSTRHIEVVPTVLDDDDDDDDDDDADDDDDDCTMDSDHHHLQQSQVEQQQQQQNVTSKATTASWRERVVVIKCILPYMAPLFLVYFAEYTINSGVASTLVFDDMSTRTFYICHQFVYQVGVFISRSSGGWFELRRLWPLPLLQWVMLGWFVLQSVAHIVPSAYAMLAFTLVEGLLGGGAYVHTFRNLSRDIEPEWKEYAMGVASVADTSGIVLAALTSLFLECQLATHNHIHVSACVG